MYIFFRFAWVYSPIFVTFVDDNTTYGDDEQEDMAHAQLAGLWGTEPQ